MHIEKNKTMSNKTEFRHIAIVAFILTVQFGVSLAHQRYHRSTSQASHQSRTGSDSSPFAWLGPEFHIIKKVYTDCQPKNDFMDCLKQKALNGISRAIDQDIIRITDGVVFEKQNQTEKQSIISVISDARSFNNLAAIDRALLTKIDKLVRTHALKVDMSTARDGEGGHEKKEKKGGHIKYVIAALLTAMGIAGPIGLKALAAIAVKALVISKVALTIAGIIALKKLFSHDGHEETSFQVHAGDHNR